MIEHKNLVEVIKQYISNPAKVSISALGSGNINDTYLLKEQHQQYVLQRINQQVFPHPERLIHNHQQLLRHTHPIQAQEEQQIEIPRLLSTLTGKQSVIDTMGKTWRMLSYIENTLTTEHTQSPTQAVQSGYALGKFHKQVANLDPQQLQIPLPGFHHLSSYLRQYDNILPKKKTTEEEKFCTECIATLRKEALILEQVAKCGEIRTRIIHGDPKIGNILFHKTSGNAVSIIDLDTVGPGLLQHDIGDWLRSVCNRKGESGQVETVSFDLELFKVAVDSYLSEANDIVSNRDITYFYSGLLAITFELGLRFFSDYLQGNIYFKCNTPLENLHKARIQFHLCQDIRQKEAQIRTFLSNR